MENVLVIGSSVAGGHEAELGWAELLEQHLVETHCFRHVCHNGTDTKFWLNEAPRVLDGLCSASNPFFPKTIIVSLSLANEGFITEADPAQLAQDFVSRYAELCKLLKDYHSVERVYCGSIYPNGWFEHLHYLLPDVRAAQKSLATSMEGVATVIDFWDPVASERGGWKKGMSADPSHPNDEGHTMMFEAARKVFR